LIVDFSMRRLNAAYVLNAHGENGMQYLNLQPELLNPAIYLNSHLKGASFFGRVTVAMDNQQIAGGDASSNVWQIQCINRTFATDELRTELYGENYRWPSNTSELFTAPAVLEQQPEQANAMTYRAPVPVRMHPNLASCMAVLKMQARQDGVCTVSAGFDSQWPLFTQSCALRTVNKGMKNTNSFLRPGLKIDVSLEGRTPMNALVERADIPDNSYYELQGAPAVVPLLPYDIKIHKITLLYESVLLQDQAELDRINNSQLDYCADVPFMGSNDLLGGIMSQTLSVSLPRGSKFCFLYFCHEGQNMPNGLAHSYQSGRFTFAPHLSSMDMSLVGKDGLILKQGLKDLEKGRSSHSLRALHADMVKKGLYSRPFDSFYPATGRGYDQVIPIDLSLYHRDVHEITNLTVRLAYTEPSRPRWTLRNICWVQRVYSFDVKNRWSWRDKI
jgi:hypothetical protein